MLERQQAKARHPARVHAQARPSDPRRADQWSRPAESAGVLRAASRGARWRRFGVSLLSRPVRGRARLRHGGNSSRRQAREGGSPGRPSRRGRDQPGGDLPQLLLRHRSRTESPPGVTAIRFGLRLGRWGPLGFSFLTFASSLIQAVGFYQIAGHTAASRAAFAQSMSQLAAQLTFILPPPAGLSPVGGYVEWRACRVLGVLIVGVGPGPRGALACGRAGRGRLSPSHTPEGSQRLARGGAFDARATLTMLGIATVGAAVAAVAFEWRDLGAPLVRWPSRRSPAGYEASRSPLWRIPVVRGLYERRAGLGGGARGPPPPPRRCLCLSPD